MKTMLLVDGNSMLFRAYYATIYSRPMTTSKGIPTNAVYGFANMFHKILDQLSPDAVLVAFDSGKKTFRHELFEDYKGGRKETPEELIAQFGLIRDYLDAMNIKRCEIPMIEADDIIGSVVKKYPDWEINVLSSDKDLLQLIDKTTSIWLMKKGISEMEKVDEEGLQTMFGISPKQVPDLKGLMGDSSDNIPGIPGVGEKTALKLLKEYGTIENLFANKESIKGKLKDKIVEFEEQSRLSKKLATIKKDVELDFDAESCLYNPNYKSLINFYNHLEMKSFVNKFQNFLDEPEEIEEIKVDVVKVCPEEYLQDNTCLWLDVSADNFYKGVLNGVALCKDNKVVYLGLSEMKKDQRFLDWLKSPTPKVIYDVKRAFHEFKRENMDVDGFYFDVMIATFLCDSTLTSWDRIKRKYEFIEEYQLSDIYGSENKPKLPDFSEQLKFVSRKAQIIEQLYIDCKEKLEKFEMHELFYELEMPLVKVLFNMEEEGICVDLQVLNEIADESLKRLEELTTTIYDHAGQEFNIKSPKQLAEILFDKLGLTSNKKRSTSIEILEKLQGFHPIIDDLMEYRKIQKLYSTYAEGLKKYVHNDGKIHTIYNQCVTQTGRLSSSDPNLQNISIRDEQARVIRRAFLPTSGNVLLASDYSQVELRMLAHMANETELIKAFQENLDIHTKTAMDIFGVSAQEVDSGMRRQAKAVNFGVVYGISDFGLSEQLGISRKEAKQFIGTYFEKYPKIKKYMDDTIDSCKGKGYVTTLLNRRREIHEIHDKNHMVREFGKRAAMNAPIQGSAADLIKLAMLHIQKMIEERGMKSKMILQVHDELIFDVLKEEEQPMKELIEKGMKEAMTLSVPLIAECKVGNTWYDAK